MDSVGSIERYYFGPFKLQPDKRTVVKDGATISVRPFAIIADRGDS